jgi:hypothetical protein
MCCCNLTLHMHAAISAALPSPQPHPPTLVPAGAARCMTSTPCAHSLALVPTAWALCQQCVVCGPSCCWVMLTAHSWHGTSCTDAAAASLQVSGTTDEFRVSKMVHSGCCLGLCGRVRQCLQCQMLALVTIVLRGVGDGKCRIATGSHCLAFWLCAFHHP